LELSGIRYKIVGLYESTSSWMEMGGVVTLRDAQSYMGRPRKVTMYMVGVKDPSDARKVVERINADVPEAHASVSGEFVEQMPDMENVGAMIGAVSFLAIAVGGVGVMNTMLMSVLERTREIGVLRALGWRRRRVLWMIIKEATLLGVLGGLSGVGIAFALSYLVANIPMIAGLVSPVWTLQIFIRAFSIAMFLGLLGGLYPAFRATRLQPVEALRYE
jgi:putative ABC transport system permease protein